MSQRGTGEHYTIQVKECDNNTITIAFSLWLKHPDLPTFINISLKSILEIFYWLSENLL